MKLCECGCGRETKINKQTGISNRFIHNHHTSSKINIWILEQQGLHFCHCGCNGEIVIKAHHHYWRIPQYINGHSNIGKLNPFYGKKHKEETKQKISKNHVDFKGKNHPKFGKHCSDETKLKISKSHKGKIVSKETKKKMKENHADFKGKNSPNWKGGISFEPYCELFNNKKKESIRNRDNRTCQLCNKSEIDEGRLLSVHHIHYDKENCYPDLISLCRSCNTKVNKNRDYWEDYFMRQLCYRKIHTVIYNMEYELDIWNYGDEWR